ncbi:MAG TPA: Lrp/AsnC family transcriptional regulator [Azospirillaceae bacterium]|nr:Lrp/AsnC family transcriptional regulator [Azospirillaceae bacterium]
MTDSSDKAAELLDAVGWRLLHELQRDARQSYTELSKRVGLTGPSVAERMRRMEAAGLIRGYQAQVDRARLGYAMHALVRIRAFAGRDRDIEHYAAETPEVLECHEVTGGDSYVLKVGAASVRHLDRIITALAVFGATQSTLILSTKVEGKPVEPPPDQA